MVEVKSTALNRLDTILRENGFKHDILGLELAGVVVEADPNSSSKVGDKVMGLVNHGGYAQYACIPESKQRVCYSEVMPINQNSVLH